MYASAEGTAQSASIKSVLVVFDGSPDCRVREQIMVMQLFKIHNFLQSVQALWAMNSMSSVANGAAHCLAGESSGRRGWRIHCQAQQTVRLHRQLSRQFVTNRQDVERSV